MDYKWIKKRGGYFLAGLDAQALFAFSTRKFYPGFKEDLDYMVAERKKFLKDFDLEIENLVCPKQAHSIESFKVLSSDRGKGAFSFNEALEDADILLSDEKGVVLSVFSADCLPLFVYDPDHKAIALSHIGWRGLAKGAVGATLGKLQEFFSSNPNKLIIGIAPAIRSCCYAIEAPATNYFRNYLIKRDNKNYLDIPEIVKKQLLRSGIGKENIFDSGICTSCKNDEFFSYRKEAEKADRIVSIATLK